MRAARVVAGVCVSAVSVVVTFAVLGPPDAGRALPLLGTVPSETPSLAAAAATLGWVGVAAVVAVTAADSVALLRRGRGFTLTRGVRASLVLVVGVLVLAAAITQDRAGYRVCCGGPASVQEVERGAP